MKEMKILIQKSNETLALANFEKVLDTLTAIHYNESTIEVPGIVVFKKEGSGTLLSKLLNAELEVITINQETFDKMIEAIHASTVENKLIFQSTVKPAKTIVLNLDKLKEQAVFLKETETAIFVNNIIFTNDKLEFHGEGMFTSRRVYFLSDLNKIKNLFTISS